MNLLIIRSCITTLLPVRPEVSKDGRATAHARSVVVMDEPTPKR
jgi:hypothetical protein